MHWEHWYMPFDLGSLESRLQLSKREVATLKRAEQILGQIREKLDTAFGQDEAADTTGAEPWVYAECYFSEAFEQLRAGAIVTPPVAAEKKEK